MVRLEKELLWEINVHLGEISAKIDKAISLLMMSQKKQIDEIKSKVLGKSNVRQEIYNLCDGTKKVGDIAKSLRKTIFHISKELSFLEENGLVSMRKVGKNRYYNKVV